MNDQQIHTIAARIVTARKSKNPLTPTDCTLLQPNDRTEAYAVQAAIWKTQYGHIRPHAWKIGDSGDGPKPVRAPMPEVLGTNGILQKDRFRRFGIEAEIAVRFAEPLVPRIMPYTYKEVLSAIGGAHVAIEIVDTALADPEASGPLMRLADSMQHGSFVLGEPIHNWRDQLWEKITATSFIDKQLIAEQTGGHPHINPFSLLPWWVNEGALDWGGVQAGDIVTTGTWNGMHFADQPNTFEARFTNPTHKSLGNVSVSFVG